MSAVLLRLRPKPSTRRKVRSRRRSSMGRARRIRWRVDDVVDSGCVADAMGAADLAKGAVVVGTWRRSFFRAPVAPDLLYLVFTTIG